MAGALLLLVGGGISRADRFGRDWPLEPRCRPGIGEPGVTVILLDSTRVEALGRACSRYNERLVAEIDSLYRAGAFGPRSLPVSATNARRSFRYRCLTAPNLFANLMAARDTVYITDHRNLRTAFTETFVHPDVFPLAHMDRCYLGRGRFCIFYRLDGDMEPVATRFQNSPVEALVSRESIRSWKGNCLKLNVSAPGHKRVDVLYQEVYAGTVRREIVPVRGQQVEIIYLDDIRGQYVCKWGKHRVGAVVVWRSVVPRGDMLPELRFFGARVYFPDIKLKLPLFIPDVGFEDLRAVEYPQPIFEAEFLERAEVYAEWLLLSPQGFFLDWGGEGPMPEAVREALPDL